MGYNSYAKAHTHKWWRTWPPKEDELKVVFETPSIKHILPKYRKSKSYRKEWFIHHGNLEEYRKKGLVWGCIILWCLKGGVQPPNTFLTFHWKCANHVVFKAEDAVVNIQLCQLLFMDTDLMLLLDLNNPGLNLLPCCIGELWLKHKSTIKLRERALFLMKIISITGCI